MRLDSFVFIVKQALDGDIDLGVGNLVASQAGDLVKNVQNLQQDVGVVVVSLEKLVENDIAVHLGYLEEYILVVAALYTVQKLDDDPFFLVLVDLTHDSLDVCWTKLLQLDAINVFFIVLRCLLLARLFGVSGILPILIAEDTESFLDVG